MAITGGYNHIHMISPDPKAAADWFVKFLGAEIFGDEELRGARNVRMKIGDANLYVRGKRTSDKIADTGGGRPYGIDHFCFSVSDIEDLLRYVEQNGGTISQPLFSLPSGNRAAYVMGPDGVHIELIEPKAS